MTQNSAPPPSVLANYNQVSDIAKGVAAQPLQQYSGPLVAGFTPQQLGAFDTIASSQGVANPYINAAAAMAGSASAPINPLTVGASDIQKYFSPFVSSVVQPTEAEFANMNAMQNQGVIGDAIQKGAWGGDRSAIAQAELAHQQALAQSPIIANLYNTAYGQALGEANTQQQAGIGAQEASGWLGENAGFALGNLGQEAQSTALTGASSNLQAGALGQQLAQEQANIPFEQFTQQQGYPFQTTGWLANILQGLGGASGGSSSTTSPGPSALSQIGGLGLTGLGLAKSGLFSGLFGAGAGAGDAAIANEFGLGLGGAGLDAALGAGAIGAGADAAAPALLALAARGGRIHRDNGGAIQLPGIPDVSVGVIPNFSAPQSRGMGIPPAPKPEQTPDPMKDALASLQGISGLNKLLNGSAHGGRIGYAPGGALTAQQVDPSGGFISPVGSFLMGGVMQPGAGGSAPPPAMSPPAFTPPAPTAAPNGIGISGYMLSPGRNIPIPLLASGQPQGMFGADGHVNTTPTSFFSPPPPIGHPGSPIPAPFTTPSPVTPALAPPSTATPSAALTGATDILSGSNGLDGSGTFSNFFQEGGNARGGRIYEAGGGVNLRHADRPASRWSQMLAGRPWVGPRENPQLDQPPPEMGRPLPLSMEDNPFDRLRPDLNIPRAGGGIVMPAFAGRGFDLGGPITGAGDATAGAPVGGGNPLMQNMFRQFATLPMEKLQELSVRLPATSPQGQLVQRALQVRRMNPTAGMQSGAPMAPAPPGLQPGGTPPIGVIPPQGPLMYGGGRIGYDDGGDVEPSVTLQIPPSGTTVTGYSDASYPARAASGRMTPEGTDEMGGLAGFFGAKASPPAPSGAPSGGDRVDPLWWAKALRGASLPQGVEIPTVPVQPSRTPAEPESPSSVSGPLHDIHRPVGMPTAPSQPSPAVPLPSAGILQPPSGAITPPSLKGDTPSELNPPGGVGTIPPAREPLSHGDNTKLAANPWMALTAAGLGMMASRSPFPGVAIGEGGLAGLKYLEGQEATEQKAQAQEDEKAYRAAEIDARKRGYDLEAKKLGDLVDHQKALERAAAAREGQADRRADEAAQREARIAEAQHQQMLAVFAQEEAKRKAAWEKQAQEYAHQALEGNKQNLGEEYQPAFDKAIEQWKSKNPWTERTAPSFGGTAAPKAMPMPIPPAGSPAATAAGLQWSPSRGQYRDAQGTVYDKTGQPAP